MKTRIIYTKFWEDNYIGSLNPMEKLVFVYLLTNARVGLSQFYEISDRTICFDTGITAQQLKAIKGKFTKEGRFLFHNGWVQIMNYGRYNNFTGEKNEKARLKEESSIPEAIKDGFKQILDTLSIEYAYPIHDYHATSDSLSNHKSIINNHKSIINNHIEGGVGETKVNYAKLDNLDQPDFQEIADRLKVPLSFVLSKYEDLENWHLMKPQKNKYANYKRALYDWVKRDALKIIERSKGDPSKRAIDATTHG